MSQEGPRTRRRRRIRWIAALAVAAGAFVAVTGAAALWLWRRGWTVGPQLQLKGPPHLAWRSVDGRNWEAFPLDDAGAEEPTADTDAREGNRGPCPPGMVHVVGNFLVDKSGAESSDAIEMLQDRTCTDWITREFPARCRAFDRDQWLALRADLGRKPMDFCIDRFEYPNVRGRNPRILVTFREAEATCTAAGRRLCTESEWTFACEGEEGTPYPYGYVRDTEACVLDQEWRPFDPTILMQREKPETGEELDRLWQGEPAGTRARCKSPFGIYDMTGNVDEWTRSARAGGYRSILKGGYWGPVRGRCRPSTRAHGEDFVAYQQGFRCCADAPGVASEDAGAPVTDAGARAVTDGDADAGAQAVADADAQAVADAGTDAASVTTSVDAGLDDEVEAIARRSPPFRRPSCACEAAPRGAPPWALVVGLAVLSASVLRRRHGHAVRRP